MMPVPRSETSVFSFRAGVEKIPRCNAKLLRWLVLWEASTGLLMRTAAPAMGHRGAGGLPGPRLSACRYDKGIGYGGIYQKTVPSEMKRFAAGDGKVPSQYL